MRERSKVGCLTLGLGMSLLLACSGGGGGSSASAVTYTGSTTAANLTSASEVSALTEEALNGANSGSFNPEGAAIVMGEQAQFTKVDLTQALTRLSELTQPALELAAGIPFSESLQGPCGGTGILSGTDKSVGTQKEIQGNLSFNNFCIPSADGRNSFLNGSLAFSMSGTASSYLFTMSSERLSLTHGSLAYVYALEYSCQITRGISGQVTLTATYQAPDGKTYRIENYQMQVDTVAHTVQVSGRFYHPDYGYVDVTTPEIITYADCGGVYRPISGRLRVTGAGGHYGEFIGSGCATYSICLDSVCETLSW